jgi:CsgH protein
MSKILASLAALLLPLGTSFAASATIHQSTARLPSCEIRVNERAGAVMLEGVVSAASALSGTYRLDVWQNGNGRSQISQSGDFTVPAGGSSSLGMVSLTQNAGGYGATLRVRWNGGIADCKATTHAPIPLSLR